MGLEYLNKVKNSFHLKNIINIRKKKFGSSPLDQRPVTNPHNQPASNRKFSKTSKLIMQSKSFMAGDLKFQKL
jgi:hypothetical protein